MLKYKHFPPDDKDKLTELLSSKPNKFPHLLPASRNNKTKIEIFTFWLIFSFFSFFSFFMLYKNWITPVSDWMQANLSNHKNPKIFGGAKKYFLGF